MNKVSLFNAYIRRGLQQDASSSPPINEQNVSSPEEKAVLPSDTPGVPSTGTETPPAAPVSSPPELDPSKSYLTLLLVSGKRKTFPFIPTETIGGVKTYLVQNWPKGRLLHHLCTWGSHLEWSDETLPTTPSSLRIVFLGKILPDDAVLQDARFAVGATTIAHLTIKNIAPSELDDPKYKDSAPKCQCIIL